MEDANSIEMYNIWFLNPKITLVNETDRPHNYFEHFNVYPGKYFKYDPNHLLLTSLAEL